MAIEARRKDFRKNMVKVTSKNPELVEGLRERAEIAKLYEATRRKVFGLKELPDEKQATSDAPASR
jgi:hypothetical protein